LFKDGWLVFDFIIVLLSWSLQQLQIIRAFRIFRALRLIARVACLQDLIKALIAVLPRMGGIACIMALIFYVFAVMFTNLFGDIVFLDESSPHGGGVEYFSRLDYTLLTLFQMMTLEWAEVAREVMRHKTWAWLPIIAFVVSSSFFVYNLIVAVVCDSYNQMKQLKEDRALAKPEQDNNNDDNNNSNNDDSSQATKNEFDEIQEQVELLQQTQADIQEKLIQLTLVLRDLGLVQVRG